MSRKNQKTITPLAVRLLQERRYTVLSAQDVADGKKHLTPDEATQLDRYARWHFNTSFEKMVQECLEMNDAHPRPEK